MSGRECHYYSLGYKVNLLIRRYAEALLIGYHLLCAAWCYCELIASVVPLRQAPM